MNFVIPMAGRGQRFVDAGYDIPKMLIEARGKTLLEWSVDSLPLNLATRLVFILLKDHEEQFHITRFIREKYKDYTLDFIVLDEVTRGQAETVILSKHVWDLDHPLVVFNIDTQFHSSALEEKLKDSSFDGIIGAFHDDTDSTRYSFATVNDHGIVVNIEEKNRISDNALTGLYTFKNPKDFIRIAEKHISTQQTSKGEFYIAPMYQELIQEGQRFTLDHCEELNILGTPEELNTFISE